MPKILAIILLVVGLILVGYGLSASNSVSSDVSRAVTGTPTHKTLWLLAGGVVIALIGVGGLLRGPRA